MLHIDDVYTDQARLDLRGRKAVGIGPEGYEDLDEQWGGNNEDWRGNDWRWAMTCLLRHGTWLRALPRKTSDILKEEAHSWSLNKAVSRSLTFRMQR